MTNGQHVTHRVNKEHRALLDIMTLDKYRVILEQLAACASSTDNLTIVVLWRINAQLLEFREFSDRTSEKIFEAAAAIALALGARWGGHTFEARRRCWECAVESTRDIDVDVGSAKRSVHVCL